MELVQRVTLIWTLIVSIAIVWSSGDVLISPGESRQNSKFGNLPTPSRVNIKIESAKIPQSNRPKNIIVQPGYEPNSKPITSQSDKPKTIRVRPNYVGSSRVSSRQTNSSVQPRPARDDGLQSNYPSSMIPSNQNINMGIPQYHTPNSTDGQANANKNFRNLQSNPLFNLPARPAIQQSPQILIRQSNPQNQIILEPGYQQLNHQAAIPRPNSPSNIAIPPGYQLPVQQGYQQIYEIENPQPIPRGAIIIHPRYGNYHGRAQSNPPINVTVQPDYDQSAHFENQPVLFSTYTMPFEPGQKQNSNIQNPQAIPPKNIVVQSPYGRTAWAGIPTQSILPAVQPVPVQSFNYGKPESESLKNTVVQPTYRQSYWVGIPQYNFPQPNSPVNRGVQPAYNQTSNYGNPETEPPKNTVIQPRNEQNSWIRIPQLNSLNNLAVQPSNEESFKVVNPQTNPPANIPVQPGNVQNSRGRSSPSIINIAFLRHFDQPNLRVENPQSIYSGSPIPPGSNIPVQPDANFVVQPGNGHSNPRNKAFQEIIPNNPPAQPSPGQPIVEIQNPQSNPPSNVIAAPSNGESNPRVRNAQSWVPIHFGHPAGFDQIPIPGDPQLQPSKKTAFQSVHGKPILKVIATQSTPPREILVQPGYGQLQCHLKFIPQGNFVPSPPRDSTFEAELQRNKDLQQLVMNQLYSMENQAHVPDQQAVHFDTRPSSISKGSSHIFTHHKAKGCKKKKFGCGSVPLFSRTVQGLPGTERSQCARSLDRESGYPGRPKLPELRNSRETPSINQKNISEVVDSVKPGVDPTIKSYLDSALDGIRFRQEQHNDTNVTTGITTRIVDAARSFEKKITDVISPVQGNRMNQDPQMNPEDSQNFQTNRSNVSRNDHRGPFDLQQSTNNQGFGGFSMTNTPNAVANFVDEYGRKVMGVVPSSFGAAIGNSNAYLKGFYENLKGNVH